MMQLNVNSLSQTSSDTVLQGQYFTDRFLSSPLEFRTTRQYDSSKTFRVQELKALLIYCLFEDNLQTSGNITFSEGSNE